MKTYSRNKRSKSATFLIVNDEEEELSSSSAGVKRTKSDTAPITINVSAETRATHSSISGFSERLHDDVTYSLSSVANARKNATCYSLARLLINTPSAIVVVRSQQTTMAMLLKYWSSKSQLDISDLYTLWRLDSHVFESDVHSKYITDIIKLVTNCLKSGCTRCSNDSHKRISGSILKQVHSEEELARSVISCLIAHEEGRSAASADPATASYLLGAFLNCWESQRPVWQQEEPIRLLKMLVEVTEGSGGQQALLVISRDTWRSLIAPHSMHITNHDVPETADYSLRLLINATNGCYPMCRTLSKGTHIIELLLNLCLNPECPYDTKLLSIGSLVNILECDQRARAIFPTKLIGVTVGQFREHITGRLSANELVRRLTDDEVSQTPEQLARDDNPTSSNIMAGMFAVLIAHIAQDNRQLVENALGGSLSDVIDVIQEFIFFQHKVGAVTEEDTESYAKLLKSLK